MSRVIVRVLQGRNMGVARAWVGTAFCKEGTGGNNFTVCSRGKEGENNKDLHVDDVDAETVTDGSDGLIIPMPRF